MVGKIIIFRVLKNTDHNTVNLFCKKFYGQKTSSHKGKYRYRLKGFLDDIPHIRLIRGVIIVLEKDASKVIKFLSEFNAEIFIRSVELTAEDEKILQK
jgi:hypothetical protein